ncbi:enoyl-CoA hydratase [Methyloligella sp. 2.7D]|uniref:enoyl-CoA hydratase n=1 Tax=unclassified Methyloligella TaxID=2625955 RepID=UPI00157C036A|nr:enoyl-CoA hydratase [Methyloligella sp. GL2]QKP77575.1 enoyl-CoA hydratase [Methyloligella sp. GL2]
MGELQTRDKQEQPAEEPLVLEEIRERVAILTLNRPKKRNALSEAMIGALQKAVRRAGQQSDVRVIVLTGAGPVFSSGHDLKELTAYRSEADKGRAAYQRIMTACSRLMLTIVHSPKPVIAAVNGIATAAGCQLVASCDLAVASSEAAFATPGVNIGLFCSTPMVALSRNVPRKKAMEMLLTGEMTSAEDALAMGLVNRLAAPDALLEETLGFAALVATKPQATLKIGKEAFYRQIDMPLEEAYGYASCVMVDNMLHAEAKEGIGAFLDKRKPVWPKNDE